MNYTTPPSAHSSLTGSQVLDIRHLHDNEGLNDAELSRRFGVSRKAIYNIVERHTWDQIPSPTTVRGFKNYTVYPDGRVFSNTTGEQIAEIPRASGPAVRIRNSSGVRTTVPVSTLLERGIRQAA